MFLNTRIIMRGNDGSAIFMEKFRMKKIHRFDSHAKKPLLKYLSGKNIWRQRKYS